MTRPPYNDARRVFWIVDNCSAHRGANAIARLRHRYPRLTLVHAPIHASSLNQIEIYFSIVRAKLSPRTILPTSTALPSDSSIFNITGRTGRALSSGSSPGRTWLRSSPNSQNPTLGKIR
jgi:hypothetical protein